MLYLYSLNINDEAIMYSSTLDLFAFKNCDTHSLQHTKQKVFKNEGKLSKRVQSALF